MSKPKITQQLGNILFEWEDYGVHAEISRLRNKRDGGVSGEVLLTTTNPEYSSGLHHGSLNFLSSSSKVSLIKAMGNKYPEANWDEIIEQLCFSTLQLTRQGSPVDNLETITDLNPPGYLLDPIMPLNQPTIIFGEGGVGKSELALILHICILLPWEGNPLNITTLGTSTKSLYCDWEADRYIINWQLKCLTEGMGLGYANIAYRRCHQSLADDIEQIQKAITDTGAKVIIIDSLGAACGGDLKDAEVAIRFFTALRQLNMTSLILAHTSKDQQAQAKTIFGSAFFYNYARSVWELRKVQEIGEDTISLGLFHRKANQSKLHPPLGFNIHFNGTKTMVTRQDTKKVDEFLQRMPIKTRVLEALSDGPMTIDELSTFLDEKKDSVSRILRRLRKDDKVASNGSSWAKLAHLGDDNV